MRDKALETKLRLLTLQLDNWKRLHDLITYGLDKAKPIISAEQERQLTEGREVCNLKPFADGHAMLAAILQTKDVFGHSCPDWPTGHQLRVEKPVRDDDGVRG